MKEGKKISVKVKPYSKKEGVSALPDGSLVVRVNALPEDGEANERATQLLAEYFKVPKSALQLLRGHTSRNKVFEIKPNCQ